MVRIWSQQQKIVVKEEMKESVAIAKEANTKKDFWLSGILSYSEMTLN